MYRVIRAVPVALCCLFAACTNSTPVPMGAVAITTTDATLDAIEATAQLTAVALNHRGQPDPHSTYSWTSSDPAIASVFVNGLVIARANGTVTITATTDRGLRGTTEIVIDQVAVAVEISPADWPTAETWIGARRQFSVTATDANGHPIEDLDATWSTSNNEGVQIDDAGLATALAAGSAVTLTAQVDAAQETLDVTVRHDVSHTPGPMYTVWFARTDSAPALLVNGEIKVPDDVIDVVSYEDPRAPWPHTLPGQPETRSTVHKFQWEGDRIGLLTDMANGSGTFRVTERHSDWFNLVIATATDFQLEGLRIAVSEVGGLLRVRVGINGPWHTLMSEGVAAFQLEGNRIAVLREDGSLLAKDGIFADWVVLEEAGVREFQLDGNRIGQLHENGLLRVRIGGTLGPSTDLADDAVSFRMDGNRIAVLHEDGRLQARDGLLGPWTVLSTEPVRQYELEDDRIGILFESGVFEVRHGLDETPTVLATAGVREFQLQRNRIGTLLENGRLRVKSGINGAWTDTAEAYGPGVTQFRLVVDVPVQPFRTTPAYYNAKQDQCFNYVDDDSNDDDYLNNCYWVSGFDLPVSNYGWYCGEGRPIDYQDIIRDTQYLTDSLDSLCRHHDTVGAWYPEAGGPGDLFGACVVRYGLIFGILTRNGNLLTYGRDSGEGWENGWSGVGMVNLKDALDNYFVHTNGCSDDDLVDFAAATASQN